jgi:ABC-type transporter Mla subunit MlaD
MLGARYVAMQLGPDDAPPLGPGDLLLGSLAGIDSFLTRASALSERLDVLLARLGNLVAADGSPGSLPTLVEKVTSLVERTGTLLSGLDETRRNLDGGIADTRGIVRSADKILSDNAGPLRELVAELAGLPEELTRTLDEYRQLAGGNKEGVSNLVAATHDTMNALRTTVDDVGAAGRQTLQRLDDLLVRNDRNLFLTLHNLRVAAEELKLAMARLRADPSQLLFGGSEDPAAAEAAARRSLERDVLDRGFLPPRWKR